MLPPDKARIQFVSTIHNFGKIIQWEPVSHTFRFRNTGIKPLFIYQVNRKCGCTTPRWTTGKIQPGDSGTVTITYSATDIGYVEKEMTVSSNAENAEVMISITADVQSAPMPEKFKQED